MERVRAQVPDVSGLFHSFPFLKPFVPENVPDGAIDDTSKYFRRMKMLGNGQNHRGRAGADRAVCDVSLARHVTRAPPARA